MSDLDEESSDSSSDFLVPADQINLNSGFFNKKTKPNLKPKVNTIESSDSNDSDENAIDGIKSEDIDNAQSADIFSQILKNLEKEQNLENAPEQKTSLKDSAGDNSKGESTKARDLASEIDQLLLQGETGVSSSSFGKQEDEVEVKPGTSEYTIPKEGVEIVLPSTNILLEKKKKKTDLETILRNKLNQRIRTTQVLIHKVGMLWWLVYGFYLNRLANNHEILATCLSLISKNDYPKGRVDLVYLQRITEWFKGTFSINFRQERKALTADSLLERVKEKKAYEYRELVLIYVALLRAIGLNCRLVVSLLPPPLKPKREQLFQTKKKEDEPKKEPKQTKVEDEGKESTETKITSKRKKKGAPKKGVPENSQDAKKISQMEARKKAAAVYKRGKSGVENESDTKKNSKPKGNMKNKSSSETESDSKVKTRSKFKSSSSKVSSGEKSKEHESKEKLTIAMKLRNRISKPVVQEPSTVMEIDEEEDSDDDFVFSEPKKKVRDLNISKNRKLISSDEEEEEPVKKKNAQDIWVEVYVESEATWICVNILNAKINCLNDIYKKASDPVLYVIAYNSVGTVKDVTRRYCSHWLTVTRKQRVDEKWWSESLAPWKEKNTALSKAEDEKLLQRELEQPLPKTVSECKGHPLYVLTRHLLKFEALYPPDAAPLGYLKTGEAIYSRYCVHTLRSRETWTKHARVVKPAQEAYKIVKAMPKYDKFSGTKIKGLPLEVFGKWQTTQYVPPEAKDGIVPRNEYGNVDLFKQCMLPKGTVHIDLPGLNRIARKLNIDCVPAVVGFDFKSVGAVPAFQGYVVCSEYEDTLREAWETEQVEASKRAIEKREKRIYGNWKKLIKGLLIRERLAARYAAGDENPEFPQEESVPVVRKQAGTKRKNNIKEKLTAEDDAEEKEVPVKKARVTKKQVPPKKEPSKKDSKPSKASAEVVNTSRRSKRSITVRRNYEEEEEDEEDEEDEESEHDFEIDTPKRKTRSQKTKIP